MSILSRSHRVLLLGILIAVPATASSTNLSGTWIRDAARSDPYTAVIGPRSRVDAGRVVVLQVDHKRDLLNIEIKRVGSVEPERTSYNLGSSLLSGGWHGNPKPELGGTKYRAKWNGSKLKIEKNSVFPGNYGVAVVGTSQEWILSPGGKTLTIITNIYQTRGKIAGPKQQTMTKEVFQKK